MPPIVEDLVGRRFGRLRVLATAARLCGKPAWLCLCQCGTTKVIIGQSLRQGKTNSCGCLHKENCGKIRLKLVGQRFGRLLVLKFVRKHRSYSYWLCCCDCGKHQTIRSTSLTTRHTTSCGCFWKEQVITSATKHGQSHTPEYVALKSRERLELRRGLDIIWTPEMDAALRFLQPACVLCTSKQRLSVDHVRPLSRGYGLCPGNAVMLCGSCNSAKSNLRLGELPGDAAARLVTAADDFYIHWNSKTLLKS